MDPSPAAPAAPPAAPPWRAGDFDAVVTDLDRTFSGVDLALDREAMAMARRLRRAGLPVLLATGRRVQDLEAWPQLQDCFDGVVAECGAVWGRWGQWQPTAPEAAADAVRSAAEALAQAAQGLSGQLERGHACFSVPADWEPRLDALPQRGLLSVQPNRDRLDVVPAGIDKAAGLRRLLDHLGLRDPRLLSLGDGENDLPVFAMATRAVAVANAAPVVLQAAHTVAPLPAAQGFVWATRPLAQAPAGRRLEPELGGEDVS